VGKSLARLFPTQRPARRALGSFFRAFLPSATCRRRGCPRWRFARRGERRCARDQCLVPGDVHIPDRGIAVEGLVSRVRIEQGDDVANAIKRWAKSWRTDGPVRNWAVCETDTGHILGGVEIREMGGGEVNLPYVLFPAFRGRGLPARHRMLRGLVGQPHGVRHARRRSRPRSAWPDLARRRGARRGCNPVRRQPAIRVDPQLRLPLDLTPEQRMKLPRERFGYSSPFTRPPLKLPGGARMIVWTVVNIEEWEITRPMARQLSQPPMGQTPSRSGAHGTLPWILAPVARTAWRTPPQWRPRARRRE